MAAVLALAVFATADRFRELREFPAQRAFMSSGLWTSWEMYLVQLGALAIVLVLLLRLAQRPA